MNTKLGLISAIIMLFSVTSCSDSCDVSTAEGAAKCTCELIRDFEDAKGDDEKTREVNDRYDRFQAEFEKQINNGAYSEEEVNALIGKMDNCK